MTEPTRPRGGEYLRTIAEKRESLTAINEEREEKIAARNARILSLYRSGVPSARIAEAASITASYVRKLASDAEAERGPDRPVTDADEVNLEWLRRLIRTIGMIDRRIAEVHDSRNGAILAAAAEGVSHQVLAETAGVGRSRVSRLVNES